jgi:hypothetical protein
MTLLDGFGIYVGWDRCGAAWLLHVYSGAFQVQVGRLLLGCDWFFKDPYVRNFESTPQIEDGRYNVETMPNPRVVSYTRH